MPNERYFLKIMLYIKYYYGRKGDLMENNLQSQIKDVIIEVSRKAIEPEEIQDYTSIIEDLKFDSLELVNLVVKLEETFHVIFDENVILDTISTFQSLCNFIEANHK